MRNIAFQLGGVAKFGGCRAKAANAGMAIATAISANFVVAQNAVHAAIASVAALFSPGPKAQNLAKVNQAGRQPDPGGHPGRASKHLLPGGQRPPSRPQTEMK